MFVAVLLYAGSGYAFQADRYDAMSPPKAKSNNDWENQQVLGINKEPGHATMFPYASVDIYIMWTYL